MFVALIRRYLNDNSPPTTVFIYDESSETLESGIQKKLEADRGTSVIKIEVYRGKLEDMAIHQKDWVISRPPQKESSLEL